MNYKQIMKWVARILILLLSLCAIVTIITDATDKLAWVIGIGGLILFILSFFTKYYDNIIKKRPALDKIIVLGVVTIFYLIFVWIEEEWGFMLIGCPIALLLVYLLIFKPKLGMKVASIFVLLGFIGLALMIGQLEPTKELNEFTEKIVWLIHPAFIITLGWVWFSLVGLPLFTEKERGQLIKTATKEALEEYFNERESKSRKGGTK